MADLPRPEDVAAQVRTGIKMPDSLSFRLLGYDAGIRDIIRIDVTHMAGYIVVGFKDEEAVASCARLKKVQRFPFSDPDHVTKVLDFIHTQMAEWNPEELDTHDYMRANSIVMSERLLKVHGG